MLTQVQWAWERGRAPRGGQCAKDRATARGKKINLIIAVARAGEGQQIPRPSPMMPSWHTQKKKRAGSELGRGFEVKSPIGRRSSRDQSDRVKPRSLIVLHPPVPRSRAVDPTQIGLYRTTSNFGDDTLTTGKLNMNLNGAKPVQVQVQVREHIR